jgi:hypothetical protein
LKRCRHLKSNGKGVKGLGTEHEEVKDKGAMEYKDMNKIMRTDLSHSVVYNKERFGR